MKYRLAPTVVKAIVAGLALLAVGCSLGGVGAPAATPTPPGPTAPPTFTPIPPTPTETPTPTATPIPQSVILSQQLETMQAPYFDPSKWIPSILSGLLKGTPYPTPEPVKNKVYKVGDREQFYVIRSGSQSGVVRAKLVYQNDVVSMWLQDGLPVSDADIKKAGDSFASDIYPRVRVVFGKEWSPGIDNDPHINILTVLSLGPNTAGQFVSSDEYPANIFPGSNQKEIFYMSWLAADVGSDFYMSALSHEFQHMIQFNNDRNESTWLNEGLSQVAQRIAGFNDMFTHRNYLFDSQVQLNAWSRDLRESYSHYGAGYLYLLYIDERFGNEAISAIATSKLKSLQSVDDALAAKGSSADDVFSDWIVANYVNNTSLGDGRFGYKTEKLIPICPRRRLAESQSQPPRSELKQYSANYVELEGYGDFTISFKGDTEVGLVPTNAKSGKWFWWSGNQDDSNVTLTHEFDLTGQEKATLEYATWYSLADGDKGFVEASTDGGQTWDFLDASNMEHIDNVEKTGPHYAGGSGGGVENPIWTRETIDLSAYAGKKILIRFEYITQNATGHGWAVDDIRVAALGYKSDVESDDGGWQADGWARITNKVPQKWAVWLVDHKQGDAITRLDLDGNNSAQTTVKLPEDGHVTIIVGAMAPLTHVSARYSLQIGGNGTMASVEPPPGVLFADDFENPCGKFKSFILPDYEYLYKDGKFDITIKTEDTQVTSTAGQEFSDITLETDSTFTKPDKDNMLGVMCRYQDKDNYYLFAINNEGNFMIGLNKGGAYQDLIPPTQADAIKTGEGAQNHLKVTCNGDQLSLTVNDSVLGTVSDLTFLKGDIGLTAATYKFAGTDEEKKKVSVSVSFDNLVVTRPQAQ